MKLTPSMRDALDEARRGPLRRVFDDTPGKPPWPAPAVTLHALVRHGLLEHGERRTRKGWKLEEWTITDAGREALEPAERARRGDTPRFLGGPGGVRYRTLPNGRQVVVERDHDTVSDLGYTTNPERAVDELEVLDGAITAGFAALAHLADAQVTAEHRARQLQARARTLRRRLAEDAFRTEHQRRQIAAQLADVESELRAVAVVGRLAA